MDSDKNADEKVQVERNERFDVSAISICRPLDGVQDDSYRLLVAEMRLEGEAAVLGEAGFRMVSG